MTRQKKPVEAVSGRYTPIPHAVLDSVAFIGASVRAKALLFELLRQHNGKNNGHLHLSTKWLKTRGWPSADQIQKGKAELIERGLAIKTRLGGLGIGPDRYALTWLAIDDFKGLELSPRSYYPGTWRMMDAPPLKRSSDSAARNGAAPPHGTGNPGAVPPDGTNKDDMDQSSIPPRGNNECCQFTESRKHLRIVGRAGKSGAWQRGDGQPSTDNDLALMKVAK